MQTGHRTNRFQLTGRLLVLGLLGLAVWNPSLPGRAPVRQAIVLLDESSSMRPPFTAAAWAGILSRLGDLPSGSRYSLIRFASRPVLETGDGATKDVHADTSIPRTRALDPTATDIESALQLALGMADPEQQPFLVLVSDGGETAGEAEQALIQARAANLPVFAFIPDAPAVTADAGIEALHTPGVVPAGHRIPLDVTLSGNLAVTAHLTVYLDSEPVAERPVTLEPGQRRNVPFSINAQSAGAKQITVSLDAPGDRQAANNRRSTIVNVDGPGDVMYVTRDIDGSPASRSLVAGGWNLEIVAPGKFMRRLQQRPGIAIVILDDIAVSDMTGAAWSALSRAVRTRGTGLLVLGGPRSFGAGGYRASTLEDLLPVTAESRDPAARAAVLFVVDKSGSMDRDNGGYSRFAYARQAVHGSAGVLLDGDLTGLLAFDDTPHTWLPLGAYASPAQELDAAWKGQPGGGTRIKPALLAGVEQLRAAKADQRLLVIVTDGFLAGEDISALPAEFEAAGIDVIALAVGKEPNLDLLRSLTAVNNGVLYQVSDITTLPALMNESVGIRRSAYEGGGITPLETAPLPFLAEDHPAWPLLGGYMVTRERPGSEVYLRSPRGDPLLATHHAGMGRVTVLPAGLDQWAGAWHDWPLWGRLLGGLTEWTGARSASPSLHVMNDDRHGAPRVMVDVLSRGGEWDTAADIPLMLRDPLDRITTITAESLAPGRYVATLPLLQPGRYDIAVHAAGTSLQHGFLHSAATEIDAGLAGMSRLRSWLDAGLIRRWQPGDPLDTASVPGGRIPLRVPLLVLALVVYTALLVAARFPVSLHGRQASQG